MSLFSDNFAAAMEALTEHHGETVVYTPSGGSSVSVEAIPYAEGLKPQARGQRGGYRIELLVLRSGITSITENADTFTIPNQWLGSNDGGTTTLTVHAVNPSSGQSGESDFTNDAYWHIGLERGVAS